MKKTLSILIVAIIILGLLPANAFEESYTNKSSLLQSDHLNETETNSYDKPIDSVDIDRTDFDNFFTSEDHIVALQNASFHFNETSESFIQKITSQNGSINGYAIDDKNNSTQLTAFFNEKKASRFNIVDIAYKNGVISESEKIETYCTLLEQQQFENVSCLHSVISNLSYYASSSAVSDTLKTRISRIFAPQEVESQKNILSAESNASTLSETDEPIIEGSYSSTNFIVQYESGIAVSEASNVANYLETIRTKYISEMGFRSPILEEGLTKYRVTLYLGASGLENDPLASTYSVNTYGIKRSTHMEVYYFSTLTTATKEVLAHEYFHAIQAAYVWTYFFSGFLDEGTASWGAIVTQGTSTSFDQQINAFLSSTYCISDFDYGTEPFYLTMQKTCGINAIKSLWEVASERSSGSLNFNIIKDEIIDEALSTYGHSFDSIYQNMARYNYNPATSYASVHPGGATATSVWTPRITTTRSTVTNSRLVNKISVCSNTAIEPYSSNYHKFVPTDTAQNSTLTVTVTFSGTYAADGVCQYYYVTSDGQHVSGTLAKTGTNSYTIVNNNYGSTITEYCVVVSSLADSENITYSVRYSVERGSETTVSLNGYHRYYESVSNISAGGYKDYWVTFSSGGNKIIQTFGASDTYLLLYNSDGTYLAMDDDDGYSSNALISYNFTANTQYRIRVTFLSTSQSGNIKLSITPSTSYARYEAITSYTDSTASLTGSYTQYQSELYTYQYSTARDLTLHMESTVDSYLYIIDPRSTVTMVAASNTSPDSTKGNPCLYNDDYSTTKISQITKTMEAGVPYLIIVSKYNPALATEADFTLTLS